MMTTRTIIIINSLASQLFHNDHPREKGVVITCHSTADESNDNNGTRLIISLRTIFHPKEKFRNEHWRTRTRPKHKHGMYI